MAKNSLVDAKNMNEDDIYGDAGFEFQMSDIDFDNLPEDDDGFPDFDQLPSTKHPGSFASTEFDEKPVGRQVNIESIQNTRQNISEKTEINKIRSSGSFSIQQSNKGNEEFIQFGQNNFDSMSSVDDFANIPIGGIQSNFSKEPGSNFDQIPMNHTPTPGFEAIPMNDISNNYNNRTIQPGKRLIGGSLFGDSIPKPNNSVQSPRINSTTNQIESTNIEKKTGSSNDFITTDITTKNGYNDAPTEQPKQILPARLFQKQSTPPPQQSETSDIFAEAPPIPSNTKPPTATANVVQNVPQQDTDYSKPIQESIQTPQLNQNTTQPISSAMNSPQQIQNQIPPIQNQMQPMQPQMMTNQIIQPQPIPDPNVQQISNQVLPNQPSLNQTIPNQIPVQPPQVGQTVQLVAQPIQVQQQVPQMNQTQYSGMYYSPQPTSPYVQQTPFQQYAPPPMQYSPQSPYQQPQRPYYGYSPYNVQLPIEMGFSTSLDRSISNFRRMFTSEFSAIVRQQPVSVPAFEVDEFADRLSSEIAAIIEAPLPQMDLNAPGLARKVGAAIDEHTKPVSNVLAEAETRNATAAEQHIAELRKLQEELESLRSVFKGATDGILRELERERQNSALIRDSEASRAREAEQRLRSLKLSEIGLETRQKNLDVEKEGLERSMRVFEQKRREWEEETLPRMYDEAGTLRRRIMDELTTVRAEINQDNFDELSNTINEGLSVIKSEGEGLRNELIELERANRRMMAFTRDQALAVRKSASPRRSRKPSVLDQTQEKLSRIKRSREESLKDLSEQFR